MLTRPRISLLLLALLSLAPNLPGDPNAGLPGAYLRAGWGARAGALGDAFVAVAEGPDALYWNPAGLALGRGSSVASDFDWMSLGRSFNTAGLVWARAEEAPPVPGEFPLAQQRGLGAIGFGWLDQSLGNDFEGRLADTPDFYSFGVRQDAYLLAYARAPLPWLALGATAKAYQQVVDSQSAQGWGLDLGSLILIGPAWRLGLDLQDLGASVHWGTGYDELLPLIVRGGIYGNVWKEIIFVNGQVRSVEGGGVDAGFGLEYRVLKFISVQGGLQAHGWTAGGSLHVSVSKMSLNVDYAFLPDPLGEGPDQRLGVLINF